jgi:hypothetical protein
MPAPNRTTPPKAAAAMVGGGVRDALTDMARTLADGLAKSRSIERGVESCARAAARADTSALDATFPPAGLRPGLTTAVNATNRSGSWIHGRIPPSASRNPGLAALSAADGNVSLVELLVINRLVVGSGATRVFEIGTFDGRTTLDIAANLSAEGEVYTLDLPRGQQAEAKLSLSKHDPKYIDKETSGTRFIGTDCEGKITQLYGDSAAFDYSPYVGRMDLVFVDASHSYEYVINDSHAARRLLRPDAGIILWHDYGEWDGVTRALHELHSAGPEWQNMRHIEGTSLVYSTAR